MSCELGRNSLHGPFENLKNKKIFRNIQKSDPPADVNLIIYFILSRLSNFIHPPPSPALSLDTEQEMVVDE